MSNKYSQKLLDIAKKSTTDAIKTASKKSTQKTAEATDDLIGKKIADRVKSLLKKIFKKCFKRITFKNRWEWNINTKRKIYISSEKRQQINDKLRLVSYNNGISNNNKFLRECTKSVI